MLFSEWHSESRNNGCENIEKLSCSVEFMILMDELVEALIDCLSDHLSSGNQLCIELVQDIFEVISFDSFFRIKQLQKFLDKLWSNVDFEALNISSFIDDQLEEELVNTLEMGPRWIDLFFLFNSCFRKSESALFNIGQWSENVLLDHLHHLIKIRNDHLNHAFLILQ